ncbi:MAG TPA: adenylate/guanylate cyclase domain-containing protein [Burkholderiaceae bacterium]|nr:adenylate/guanylate cyclase domain-containing protein [Burkholderiaceae bacterium]
MKPAEERRAARRLTARSCAVAAVLLALLAAPLVGRLDLAGFDLQAEAVRRLRTQPPVERDPVALVGIDDATLAATGDPLPLSLIHLQLGRALEAIASAQPRLVVIDIALAADSVESLRSGYDAALMGGLIAARDAAGVVATLTNEANGTALAPYPPFVSAAGEDAFGFPIYPVDADNVVRRFDPAQTGEAPSLLGRVAARLHVEDRVKQAGWIDFTRGAAFSYTPLVDVVRSAGDPAFLRARFAGKVVLIGSVLPYVDRLPQPVNLAAWEPVAAAPPGVILNAQAVRSILGTGLIRPAPLAAAWGLAVLFALLAFINKMVGRWFALAAAIGLSFVVAGVFHAAGVFLPLAAAWTAGVAAVALRTSADVYLAREERRRLTQTFGGYVSPQLLRAIISGQVDLRGGRRPMAFMFADLRGFTAWSERTEPEQVLDVLNRYYAAVTPIVHFHGGTIDNFRGDGIMVMFGAPEPHAAPCEGAFRAARGILAALEDLNRTELAGYDVALSVAIGLAYGDAVFGDLGSVDRKDFTALGDAVNVAARLQDLAKSLGFPVLMTAAFAASLSAETRAESAPEELGDAPIKGHSSVAIAGWPPTGRSDRAVVE